MRRFPGSRRNPGLSNDAMGTWLPEAGVGYLWEARLVGRRRIPAGKDDDVVARASYHDEATALGIRSAGSIPAVISRVVGTGQ